MKPAHSMPLFNYLNNNKQKINTMQREKEDTKATTPEEGCCNTAAEQAPVTVEMIKEAYDRLEELVNQCETPALLCMIVKENDGNSEYRNSSSNSVSKVADKERIVWNAARGFLYASGTCFSGNPEVISQGIKHAFEFLERNEKRGVFAAIIDTPFDH